MKALVLCAGEGQRLRPLTNDRPKPMLSIGDRPLLERIVVLLRQHGITDIAINLHYKPLSIVNHLGEGSQWGVHIRYSYEEELLGSAGAARRLAPYLKDAPFVVFYGDLFTDLNLGRLLVSHKQGNAWVTMGLYTVDNPTACGIVELDRENRVTRFMEKPQADEVFSRLANAGVFVVEPQVLDLIPPETTFDFGHDLFPRMLSQELPIQGYVIEQLLIDIGTKRNYERAQEIAVARA